MIVITEIPYQVNKRTLLEKIGELVNEKKIEGISDILDLSDRKGIRVEIHLKRDANAQVILNQLLNQTQLQISYGIIMLGILGNKPKIFNLKELLQAYSDHRKEVIVRRTKFDLDKAEKRAHILEGLKIALDNLDEVIQIIRSSQDPKEAKDRLMAQFVLSEVQTDAILDMRLQKLTSLEVKKIIEELEEVRLLIADLKDILAKPERVIDIVCKELKEVADKYGEPRLTEISYKSIDSLQFNQEDLIADEEIIIQLTEDMFIKRMPYDTFRRQRRGGRGVQGASVRNEDFIKKVISAKTHDNIMFFSNKGKAYTLKAYELPQANREARGKSLKALIQLDPDETITSIFNYREQDNSDLLMVTRNGFIKKCSLSQFTSARKSGIIALGLREGDQLIEVVALKPKEDVIIGSRKGLAIRMSLDELKAQGRTASGVTGMRLAPDDALIGVAIVKEGHHLLVITEKGYGKRTEFSEFSTKGRGGKGMAYLKVTSKNGNSVGIASVRPQDEVLVITQNGMVIRVASEDISISGRTAMGVRIVDTKEEDRVIDFAVLTEDE